MRRTIADETNGKNRLILRELESSVITMDRKRGRKFQLEYQWMSDSGGVLGNEFTYWTAREISQITSGHKTMFEVFQLF